MLIALILASFVATSAYQFPPRDGLPTETTQVDLVKWGMTQGALALVLLVVLWSYRRDFFRKLDERQALIDVLREEKNLIAGVIDKNTGALQSQALALAANTQATQTLATNVDRLERSIKP